MIISSSIISLDFLSFEEELKKTERAGVDWLHIDVMDGQFVPNITIGSMFLPFCKKATNLPLDVHLMINQPERHIEAFAKAGADYISIHIENNPNVLRTIQQIKELGCKAGIVLNPGSPTESIEEVLPFIDLVLVMSVNPGFSGQKFLPEMLPKIKKIRKLIDLSAQKILLQVDGGINKDTIKSVIEAGADVIVAATAIYDYPQGIKAGVDALRNY
ncbi:MAG: ribulose-phosphate 3-epimerase [Chloroflexi bacterium HGW-Chloroflexi-2]|jgi:ribulose-phosphate 3-epimerase|nr:MAG: ribulose-phosphate 3-epimerase [Chloroflexi bacterium HGW-Chloroflexi-2]